MCVRVTSACSTRERVSIASIPRSLPSRKKVEGLGTRLACPLRVNLSEPEKSHIAQLGVTKKLCMIIRSCPITCSLIVYSSSLQLTKIKAKMYSNCLTCSLHINVVGQDRCGSMHLLCSCSCYVVHVSSVASFPDSTPQLLSHCV